MASYNHGSIAETSSVVSEILQTSTQFSGPLKGAEDKVPTVTSLPADMAEVLQHMNPNRNKDSNHLAAAEPEKRGSSDEAEDVSCGRLDVKDHHHDEEEEDYDEVVVNQTPLNDVTCMTDRTSPWTSVLSDPDLASLESGEQEEDLVDLNLEGSGSRHRREEDSCSLVGSGEEASDVESDSEAVTLQNVPQQLSEEEEEEGPTAAGSKESRQQPYPFSLLPTTSAVC